MESQEAAQNQRRLIAAVRDDNEEMLQEVFEQGNFDINFQDGLGNTALHYAAMYGSTDVLEHILSHEDCDVDPINRLEGATPLHLAVVMVHKHLREPVVSSLLDAGADTSIKNKRGDTAIDLISRGDTGLLSLFHKARVMASVSKDDMASDDEGGSGSASD